MPIIPSIRSLPIPAGNRFRRDRPNRDLDAELAEHLNLQVERPLGKSPAQARRNVLPKLGGVDQTPPCATTSQANAAQ